MCSSSILVNTHLSCIYIIKGNTKFWEILKIEWQWFFTILIYLDAPVDVLKALENLAP